MPQAIDTAKASMDKATATNNISKKSFFDNLCRVLFLKEILLIVEFFRANLHYFQAWK